LSSSVTILEIANMMNSDKAIDDGNSGIVIGGEEVVGDWVGWEVAEGAMVDLGAVVGVIVGETAGEVEGVAVTVAPNAITTTWLL
jgi:hypothetical protein